MEMYFVDKEMVGTEQAYWMEVGHSADTSGNRISAQGHGQFGLWQNARHAHRLQVPQDDLRPAWPNPVDGNGNRTQTAPERNGKGSREVALRWDRNHHCLAGTSSCEHWTSDEGKGEVWASTEVGPMGLVKSVENGRTMVLVKLITDAKTKITGSPVKFDPKMMMQQRMQQRQQLP
jgi:hypothetical protein